METSKKKSSLKVVVALVLILVLGAGIGFGVMYFTKSKDASQDGTESDPLSGLFKKTEEETTVEGGEDIADSVPSQSSYEGSEAELEVKKEITETDQETLREKVGDIGYVNKAYGYAFVPPEDFFEDGINSDISPFVYYTSYDPKEATTVGEVPGVKVEVVVQENAKNQTLDEWIEEGHSYMDSKSLEKITVGDFEAVKEEVDYEGMMTTVTLLKEGDVYTFALYGSDKEYEQYKDDFDQLLETLVVLPESKE